MANFTRIGTGEDIKVGAVACPCPGWWEGHAVTSTTQPRLVEKLSHFPKTPRRDS